MLRRFPIESKGRQKKLNEVFHRSQCINLVYLFFSVYHLKKLKGNILIPFHTKPPSKFLFSLAPSLRALTEFFRVLDRVNWATN